MARFSVISREEIQNLAKTAVSKNTVKTMNYFFLFFFIGIGIAFTDTNTVFSICIVESQLIDLLYNFN